MPIERFAKALPSTTSYKDASPEWKKPVERKFYGLFESCWTFALKAMAGMEGFEPSMRV